MARKNIQDDGSYQKKQIGKAKGRFDKKEEEWEPPIRSSMYAYRPSYAYDDKKSVFVDDVEQEGLNTYQGQEQRLGYMPLDADGYPAPGMVPFEGDAADMLSKENKKAAINRHIERNPMTSEKELDELEKQFGKIYRKGNRNVGLDLSRGRNKAIKDELKKLDEKKEKK